MPETDRVSITHPSLPDSPPADVSRLQFKRVWEPRGWQDTDTASAAAAVPEASTDTATAAATGSRRKTTADPATAATATPDTPKGN